MTPSLADDIARLEFEKLSEMAEACFFEYGPDGKPLRGYLDRRVTGIEELLRYARLTTVRPRPIREDRAEEVVT
jgi:hypothetical protein